MFQKCFSSCKMHLAFLLKSCWKKLKGSVPSNEKPLKTNSTIIVLKISAFKHNLINTHFAFAARKCSSGWTGFQYSCYFTSSGKSNWTAAREYCQNKGADLAIVKSQDEMVCLAVCICLYLHD